jgi:hypothetical protein
MPYHSYLFLKEVKPDRTLFGLHLWEGAGMGSASGLCAVEPIRARFYMINAPLDLQLSAS